jgi:UDP-N-acetylglucosamine--N-acetylmuramyl-(pentapeptide) pyrophosphoryl-undecaprenol N-acetylglucosamine transferase
MTNDPINILLTGGHAATTAASVVKEIKKTNPNWNLYWVGPISAVEGNLVPTLASQIMPELGVKYIPIITGRLQRKFTIWTIPSLLKIPYGVFNAFKIINSIKPKIIISFGGYASVPLCLAGWVLRIPVITHEQTVAVGRANKINAFFAKKILIAREESRKYLPANKTILIGNPVSPDFYTIKSNTKTSKLPTIYITGGSSGAQRINKVIEDILFDLLKKYKVIHQTGFLDYEKFKEIKNSFPSDLKNNYEVYDFVDPNEVSEIFKKSDMVVSRAGANTLSEIMAAKLPAVLIPIPWTAYNEQVENARMVEKTGLAIVLEEKDLTPQNLLEKINYVLSNRKSMIEDSDSSLAQLDKTAAQKFVEEIKPFFATIEE